MRVAEALGVRITDMPAAVSILAPSSPPRHSSVNGKATSPDAVNQISPPDSSVLSSAEGARPSLSFSFSR
jgi:hypothetical protein